MFRIQHKAAALFLAGVTAFASPAAAFGAQQQSSVSVPAHIRVVTRAPEKKENQSLQFDSLRFFDYSYNDDIDRKLFMKRLDEALAACTKAGEGAETQVKEMTAVVKALGKLAKQIKSAKAAAESADDAAFSEHTLILLARIDYARKRTASVRKEYKHLLKSAQKAEQEELARKAQEEEAARIAAEKAAAERAAAAAAAEAARAAANEEASYNQTASNSEASQTISSEGSETSADYQQERAGYVEASQTENTSYDDASQTYYDQEADSTETASSDETADAADNSGEGEVLADEEGSAEAAAGEESVSGEDEDEEEASEAGYEEEADDEDTSEADYEEDEEDEDSSDDADDEDEAGDDSSAEVGFKWPVSGTSIASDYGEREAPMEGASSYHEGIDINASEGEDISAAASGTVTEAGYNDAMGNYVVIDHGDGISTTYEHCSDIYTEEGDTVSQGETIGTVGSTGIATGAHLHFGVSIDGESVDPTDYDYEY